VCDISPLQPVTLNADLSVGVKGSGLVDTSMNVTGRDCCGICEYYSCSNEVFIACPTCLQFLCYDHMNSNCEMHGKPSTPSANHDSAKFVVVVDDQTGLEFLVPFEDNFDYTRIDGINSDGPVESEQDVPYDDDSLECGQEESDGSDHGC